MASNTEFTSNAEMDCLSAGDNTVEVCGFVDKTEGSRLVGQKVKKLLYKFILSNDLGRRIRICLWEADVTKYESVLKHRDIVRIKYGKIVPVDMKFFREEEEVLPIEVSFQKSSTLEVLGSYPSHEQVVRTCKKINFEEVGDSTGLICIDGYIKVPFIKAIAGSSIYGIGAITDGFYKLRVHVVEFQPIDELKEGIHVFIKGELAADKYGSPYVRVKDMTDIGKMDDETLTSTQLKEGFRSTTVAKRKMDHSDDKENHDSKKEKVE